MLEEEPHVCRHLIVATAGGMKAGSSGDSLSECLLDVHVHILKLVVPLEVPCIDLLLDRVEPLMDGIPLIGGDQSNMGQHG